MTRLLRWLLPWPSRREREAAIERARGEKHRSQAAAGHAAEVADQIQQMREENHFAAAIAREIMRRHKEGGAQ